MALPQKNASASEWPALRSGAAKDRAVAAAPGDDHLGARLEHVADRLRAHDGDDAVGAVERGRVAVGAAVETPDRGAVLEAPPDVVDGDLGVDRGQPERPEAMLGDDLPDQPHVLIDPAVGARVRGRAEDQRDAETSGREQHRLDVVALPDLVGGRPVRAQRIRSDVGAAGVGDDEIGRGRAAALEARPLERRRAEVARRGDDPDGLHEDLSRG